MADFNYEPIFQHVKKDETEYDLVTTEHVEILKLGEREFLKVDQEAIEMLTEKAFDDISHLLRPSHLKQLGKILEDPEASKNDRFVALDLLRNAIIAADRVFPSCQDTGTAIVLAKKGQEVLCDFDEEEALSRGVFNTYQKKNLRYSQVAPITMYEEKNTGSNLPVQIDYFAKKGNEMEFLFIAKGGGSANKSYLYQKTKALLNPKSMEEFVKESFKTIGTAACPPYHLAYVIGGTSAEQNLKTVKLASTKYYDDLPTEGSAGGRAFRDIELEKDILKWAQECGIGAQFGGKYFAHDVRVVRLPRHGASCPVGIGVSCSADRQAKAKITKDGVFLEKLEKDPAQYLPKNVDQSSGEVVSIDLNQGMSNTLKELSKLKVATQVSLTGTLIVARDIAHAKLKELLDSGKDLPDYFKEYPVYYAGPAKTPEGHASGSFGPTTSQRMDSYVNLFQENGGSMVMLGKGNRSKQVTDSCAANGGFYLGSIGGPAARLGKECIKKVEVQEYKELGMEAIWKIEVEDFPAFIIVDDKGNDFFKMVGVN
ncbi:MAG: fumarate hydratase [Bdellovibrionota bacterium]|tara:strand:- start:171 stop:1790 length:1620 start_codon:yes stop_codon:yes gene_type:complete